MTAGGGASKQSKRDTLRRYADCLSMWDRGFDTLDIAQRLAIPEGLAAMWIAHWRDLLIEGRAA